MCQTLVQTYWSDPICVWALGAISIHVDGTSIMHHVACPKRGNGVPLSVRLETHACAVASATRLVAVLHTRTNCNTQR